MKRICLFLISLSSLLASCSNIDVYSKQLFLNAKFKLSFAAFNEDYNVTDRPAYFFQIPDCIDCIDLFNKEQCFATYQVKMQDGKPLGYGSFDIVFTDNSIKEIHETFNYICYYTDVYGGEINQTEDTKLNSFGIQYCRMKYWFVRMECWFPELSDKRILLEFSVIESYEDLPDFDRTLF